MGFSASWDGTTDSGTVGGVRYVGRVVDGKMQVYESGKPRTVVGRFWREGCTVFFSAQAEHQAHVHWIATVVLGQRPRDPRDSVYAIEALELLAVPDPTSPRDAGPL